DPLRDQCVPYRRYALVVGTTEVRPNSESERQLRTGRAYGERRLDGLADRLHHSHPRIPLVVPGNDVPTTGRMISEPHHVLDGGGVRVVLVPVAPVLVGQLPRSQRVILPTLEPTQLLLG